MTSSSANRTLAVTLLALIAIVVVTFLAFDVVEAPQSNAEHQELGTSHEASANVSLDARGRNDGHNKASPQVGSSQVGAKHATTRVIERPGASIAPSGSFIVTPGIGTHGNTPLEANARDLVVRVVGRGGTPVADYELQLRMASSKRRSGVHSTKRTDEQGLARWDSLDPMTYEVSSGAPNSWTPRTVQIKKRGTFPRAELRISLSTSVIGRIEGSNGEPVSAAVINFQDHRTGGALQRARTTAKADGSYRLDGLPASTYRVWVEAKGLAGFTPSVPVEEGRVNIHNVHVSGKTIQGHVVLKKDGAPLSRATVYVTQQLTSKRESQRVLDYLTCTPNRSGHWLLFGLKGREYHIAIRPWQTDLLPVSRHIILASAATEYNTEIEKRVTGLLTLTILGRKEGERVTFSRKFSPNGTTSMGGLGAEDVATLRFSQGPQELIVKKNGKRAGTLKFEMPPGGSISRVFDLDAVQSR